MSQLSLKYKFKSLIDIKREEFGQTFLMFVYNFLIFGSHTIIKSIQKASFIHGAGAAKLPYVYIGIAVVAGFVMQGYARLAQTTRRSRSIIGINLFFITNIIAFWWLFRYEWRGMSYALYIWAGIFSAVSIAQFWLIVNEIFTIRQAKRLLGFVLSGGTLGAILAGLLSRGLVDVIRTENLFLVPVAQLLGCAIIATQINFRGAAGGDISREPSSDQDIAGAFTLIRKNKHLTLLAMIIGVTVVATTLVDFQFNSIIEKTYKTRDALTGFFGSYYAYISAITVLFQILVTGKFLKRFGVGVAILVMPFGLFLGSGIVLFQPVLWAAIFTKTCDDIFSPSINKWGTEILYIPIPTFIKSKAKSFIDVAVERTSKGIGGLLLLFLTLVGSLSVQHLSIPTLVFLLVWILLCIRIYREYIASIEASLEKRSLNIDSLAVDLSDSATMNQLIPLLTSDNERQILYALELLQDLWDVRNPELMEQVKLLCHHPSSGVRERSLRILFNNAGGMDKPPLSQIEELLMDESEKVRTEAIHYISVYGEAPATEQLRSFLEHPDYKTKSAAITCITRYGNDAERALLTPDLIEKMLSEEGPHRRLARLGAAKALGVLGKDQAMQNHLLKLFDDEDVEVVRQAIFSAGETKRVDFVPFLIEKLGDSRVRVSVRKALAKYGRDILDTLLHTMTDEQVSMLVRRQIPKVNSMIPHQDSVDALLDHLSDQNETDMRYKIIRALGELRAVPAGIRFDDKLVEEYIAKGIRDYYYLSIILEAQSENSTARNENHLPACCLLHRALKERLEITKEMIFRLMGLAYPQGSIYNAYLGVSSHSQRVQANAVEFLDNILNRNIKRMLFPIFDSSSEILFMERASGLWGFQTMTETQAIIALTDVGDSWLKACMLHALAEKQIAELQDYVKESRGSANPLIRESAELAWRKLELNPG